jgi:transcriptional regulator with XRE-family HTH domain
MDDTFQVPICSAPNSIESTSRIASHRSEAVQIVGKRVREIRKLQALSQGDLASRMNVPRTYLSKVETCKVVPTVGTLRRIAAALGVDVCHLLYSREFLELTQDEFFEEIAPLVPSLTPQQRAVILRAARDAALRRNCVACFCGSSFFVVVDDEQQQQPMTILPAAAVVTARTETISAPSLQRRSFRKTLELMMTEE